jgi:hypothetical protein
MRTTERECKQKSTNLAEGHAQQVAQPGSQLRPQEQTSKIRATTTRGISAQQFRDLRYAERLRKRPTAEPAQ